MTPLANPKVTRVDTQSGELTVSNVGTASFADRVRVQLDTCDHPTYLTGPQADNLAKALFDHASELPGGG